MLISNESSVKNIITDSESKSFNIIKAIAILSAITAHLNIPINNCGIIISIVTNFWAAFSITGVPAFFILSGFFYHRKENDMFEFWAKKLKFVVFPWLIFSFASYMLSCYLNSKFSIMGYIKWMSGYYTWYYYMSMLILMYVIFKFLKQNDFLLCLCIVINILAIIFTTFHSDPILPFITNYLNIFHWIGFFALGVLMRKYRFERVLLKNNVIFFICIVLFFIDCILLAKLKNYTYFHIFSFQYELTFFIILLYLGNWLSNLKNLICQSLIFIGRNTLFIYLTHMQIVQFILNRFPKNLTKYIIQPFVGLVIMAVITFIIKFTVERILKRNKLLRYFGIV